MLKGLEKQLQMLLEQKSPVNDKIIEVIATAGSHISFNISDIYPFLERMCLDGTRTQAKFAVSALAAFNSEQSIFLKLYEALIDSMYSQWNLPTTLQSLGCIAQFSLSTFETRAEEITSHIYQKIIQMKHLDDGQADPSQCCESCQLKIFGLKTLVKSFLPYQWNHVKRNIKDLLDILSRMLHESNNCIITYSSLRENDEAHIRLAVAKAVLRLSRKWDLHITPEIFRYTILTAKDSSSFVRNLFLNKTHKLLKEHKLPIRFACAFALEVTNGSEDLQYDSYKYLAGFIKDYSLTARKQNHAVEGAIIDFPAYVVVFLIHVLAQNSDFPFEGCQDEKLYADLCSPLFFLLQALVDVSIVDGDVHLVNDSVLHLFSIFRAIRKAEDAVDPQTTAKLHILAEMGMFALNALKPDAISLLQAPGQILLPSSLYKANSKCLKSFCDESFLSRVFFILKSKFPQACTQKLAKALPKHGHKGQEDVPKSNVNFNNVLDLAPSKPDNLPRRAITNAKSVRQDIPSKKSGKHAPPSDCGSVGLHECSTIEKQKKLSSKHGEKNSKTKMLSSCDSVRPKSSQEESRLPSHRSKRAAASSLENTATNIKLTAQHFKCPRINYKDSCASKKQNILADVSNKNVSHCDSGERSSLSSIKKIITATERLVGKEGTSLNHENASVIATGKCKSSASEVVDPKEHASSLVPARRTRQRG